jgi:cardiolipin synthase
MGRGAATALLALVLLAGAGCAVLPDARYLEERDVLRPVEISNARGPLSPKQSAAIIARMKTQAGDSDILERHVAVEQEIVGTPLVADNAVTLLEDGPATYAAMLTAILAAKSHVHLESFIVEDDEIGNKFADALLQLRERGVQVRLIYDSVGSSATPKAFFDKLRDGGVQVLEFNPVNPLQARKGWRINNRDHRKLLIVDGQVAFVGGINISGVYSSPSTGGSVPLSHQGESGQTDGRTIAWRDTHLRMEGPVVAEFQKLFLDTWATQKGEPPATEADFFPQLKPVGKDLVRAIGSKSDAPHSLIYLTLLSAINSAETTIHLTNAYFVPDPQLLRALTDAAGRGVDVKLILPSVTDFWAVFHAGRGHYSELLEGGVKIYERQGALLHSKSVVIDGVWSCIGSTNLDWRSFLHNDEVNAIVLGPAFARQMETMFEKDLKASNVIDAEAWRQRGLGLRLKEGFARLLEYWL